MGSREQKTYLIRVLEIKRDRGPILKDGENVNLNWNWEKMKVIMLKDDKSGNGDF